MGENSFDTTKIISDRPILAERFEMVKHLGQGAAGAVFLVRDLKKNGHLVALKILTKADAFDEHTLKRFITELEVAQEIKHPNIVAAYDLIEMNDSIAYTMEYVEGKDLSTLAEHRLLSYGEIDSIMTQILNGLSELHSRKILHRDLKLENILVSTEGNAKLVDLGLMKRMGEASKLTKTGILLGTAQYLPPEYIKEGIYDEQSDIYAAGLILYELLSGERRLQNFSGNEAIDYLLETGFRVPRVSNLARGQIPAKYEDLLEKSLNPRPKKRYSSALDMASDFNRTLVSETVGRNQVSNGIRGKSPDNSGNSQPWILRGASKKKQIADKPTYFARGLVLALLVLGAYASFSFFQRSAIPLSLQHGYYEGEWTSINGSKRSIYAQVSDNGFFIFLNEPRCQGGFVNSLSGSVACTDKSYKIKLKSDDEQIGLLYGIIIAGGVEGNLLLHYARR